MDFKRFDFQLDADFLEREVWLSNELTESGRAS
jgi:hypothetical protein